MLTIERIDSLYGMQALQETWATLLDGCGYRNLFLSHDWAVTWWKHFGRGRELYFLLVLDGARPVGIAPMMISRTSHRGIPLRRMEFLTNKHTSRADFILPERAEACIQAIVSYWEAHAADWDMILLQNVPCESGTLSLLSGALRDSSLSGVEESAAEPLGYLPLDGSWEGYLGSRSRKFRKAMRYRLKQLDAIGKIQYRTLSDPAALDATMAQLFELESRSWKAGITKIALDDEDRAFHRDLAGLFAQSQRQETVFLELDGKVISGVHVIVYYETIYGFLIYYDASYARVGAGWLVLQKLIQASFGSKRFREFDFNGIGELSESWTERAQARGLMQIYNARPYSRLLKTLKRLRRLVPSAIGKTMRVPASVNE